MLIHIRDADLQQYRSEVMAGLAGHEVAWVDPSGEGGLEGVEVLIAPRFTRADGESADALRLLQVAGAGLDNIVLEAVPAGAACANLYRHEGAIGEYVVTATAMLRRGLLVQDRALRRGVWLRPTGGSGLAIPGGLGSARVGFVGFGHIGQASWRLFQAFGASGAMAVSARGGAGRDVDGVEWWGTLARLDELCAQSDVVVVSLPDSADTRGLIGRRQLDLIGQNGVLVNVGRGPVVVVGDLHAALASRRLGAAAIDVWYNYPAGGPRLPADQDFGGLDNVLMTPHVSGVSRETYRQRIADLHENVRRVAAGEPVLNRVN